MAGMEGRGIVASNAGAKEEILKCAMYSYCGRIIYKKWNEKEHRFIRRSHVVIPIDCGVTSRGNEVLFAEDVEENMQVKQFIIDQILDFENLREKRKTAFPIKLDNIKRMFGIRKPAEEYDVAAGLHGARRMVAMELSRIAQEIYEFSGCEANLYSESKRRNPESYEVVGREERIANGLVAKLSDSQRRLTEHFTSQRAEGLSFGDYFKWDSNGRCYIPVKAGNTVQDLSKIDDSNARRIFEILKGEGYVCPDYATGYCYKESDKDYSAKNAPKVLTVLKKALRNDRQTFGELSKAFNERESGALKRKGNVKLLMCITHNPEDIAGMSTDRDWISCMRLPSSPEEISENELLSLVDKDKGWFNMYADFYGLFGRRKKSIDEVASNRGISKEDAFIEISNVDDKIRNGGAYYTTALKQVKHGGMVAYLIRDDDKGIEKPLARVAIKRFENGEGGFLFKPESRIYGDVAVADSCGFMSVLSEELGKSNKTTEKGGTRYRRNDGNSWSDAKTVTVQEGDVTVDGLCSMSWNEVYDTLMNRKPKLDEKDLDKIIKSHRYPPPQGLFDVFEKFCGSISDDFVDAHAGMMDIDKRNFMNGVELIPTERYQGDDAPRSEEDMLEAARESLDNVRYGDDYGSVDEDRPMFYGSVSPVDVIDAEGVPDKVMDYAMNAISWGLKDYYDSNDYNDEFKEKYENFAMFEEAYFNGSLDDKDEMSVMENLSDRFSWDVQVEYMIEVGVSEVSDGYDDHDSVYVLDGTFLYRVSEMNVVAYSNETVINTEDAGWKKKLDGFTKDLFDQLPRFYF